MARKSKPRDLAKGDVITVRLSPKLKYGLELLSRKQHRTISSIVTWAVEQMITNHECGLFKEPKNPRPGKGMYIPIEKYMLDVLWDVDPADRLVKLAKHWPELMTFEEELIVKTIKKEGWGWPKKGDSATEQLRQMWPDILIDPDNNDVIFIG